MRAKTDTRKKQDKALQEVAKRAKRFGGLNEPSTKTLERYIAALDEMRQELETKYGDLGSAPKSAGGKLKQERDNALALLARLRINTVKPG